MPRAFEVIDSFATNPGAGPAFASLLPFPGDTFAVRNFDQPAKAWLVEAWGSEGSAGVARLHSPFFHDNVQGLRFRLIAGQNRSLLSSFEQQQLVAQDAIIAEIFGGAAETDGFSWLNVYEDLPGASARLIDWPTVEPRIVQLVNVEVAVAGGAAVGTRSASSAINATFDLLKANTDYALLGYEVDASGLSVGFRGIDTSNLRVGGPMTTERIETRDWFTRLSNNVGLPLIPIFNSANKGGILVDTAQVVAGVAANVTAVMAQLSP